MDSTAESPAARDETAGAESDRGPKHDEYAKYVFGEPTRAAEALAAAMGPEKAALIDWSTLTPAPVALADAALHHLYPDLRFHARLQDRSVRIDVIFEHQSEVDPLMPARFFCEIGAVWTQARREDRHRMPFVLNVVLYNGTTPWKASRDVWSTIEEGQHLRDRLPEFLPAAPFLVEDLAVLTDDELHRRTYSAPTRLGMLLLKHARRGNHPERLLTSELVRPLSDEFISQCVRYIFGVSPNTRKEDVVSILEPVLGSRGRQIPMTEAERSEARGEARGVAKGRAEGLVTMLLHALQRRGLSLSGEQRALVLQASNETQIERWFDEVLEGRSLDEVFKVDVPGPH